MNKAVILISGTPEGKNSFDAIIKKTCWTWHCNSKNHLGRIAKDKLFWDGGERDENYERFLSDFFSLVNESFNFEEKYIRDLLDNKFLQDSDEYKISTDGRKFEKFLFVVHGLSSNLVNVLEDEYGAIKLHVSLRSLNTNIENHDYVLYSDDIDFEEQVNKFIEIITHTKMEA